MVVLRGLGVLAGQVRRFGSGENTRARELKVPHMGWNNVTQHGEHPLWLGIPQDTRFYFVHSYYADARAPDQVTGTTNYECAYSRRRDNVLPCSSTRRRATPRASSYWKISSIGTVAPDSPVSVDALPTAAVQFHRYSHQYPTQGR